MRLLPPPVVRVLAVALLLPAALRAQQAPAAAAPVPASAAVPAGEYPGLETGKMWTFDVPPLEYAS